jgi:membrane-bound hydrogenase subunit alpha
MIGGVRRDLLDEGLDKIERTMDYFEEVAQKLFRLFLEDKTVQLRTQNTGVLTEKEALELCAVGPTTRASGVRKEVRQDQPYSAYADFEIKAVTPSDLGRKTVGDVWDRIAVRLLEVKQSAQIVKRCVAELPHGELLAEPKLPKLLLGLKKVNNEGFGMAEAPRGEVVHWVKLQEKEQLHAWKARAPTYNNLLTWRPMLIGEQIADIPIVAASTDPCFSCTDRVILTRNNKSKVMDGEELHRLGVEKTRRLKRWS